MLREKMEKLVATTRLRGMCSFFHTPSPNVGRAIYGATDQLQFFIDYRRRQKDVRRLVASEAPFLFHDRWWRMIPPSTVFYRADVYASTSLFHLKLL